MEDLIEMSNSMIEDNYEVQKLNEMYAQKDEEARKKCEENRARYRKEQEYLNALKRKKLENGGR